MYFAATALAHLAEKICQGDVVFFLGTGCSIDSECNTSQCLMRRLLFRVVAFAEVLGESGGKVLDDLCHTFRLQGGPGGAIADCSDNVDLLAQRYYEANEWFCDAFSHLLEIVSRRPDCAQILCHLRRREEELRLCVPEMKRDPVPLGAIPIYLVGLAGEAAFQRAAGKMLFLDTMGFRNPNVMGGCPDRSLDLRDVEASYKNRLLPRHHILARLAREGLWTTLITTNFDMLVEGAYLLAGFPNSNPRKYDFPKTLISDFEVIASRSDFFTKGKTYRTAVVVKMHGCAQRYRDLRLTKRDEVCDFLPSMVFTYREIQNWREDSWAADYLRTLLRTRVVVFCGYSVRDPVIHDTFRTVYEEMGRTKRPGLPAPREGYPAKANSLPASNAPAFFFAADANSAREFHGMAVLQAASEAIGAPRPPFGEHPNYLRFNFRDTGKFPNFDELMRWLFHLTMRIRQEECLASDLRRITTLLLGAPRPETELAAVNASFRDICKQERSHAESWAASEESRRQHAFHCGWTDFFPVGLLREFACSDLVR
jgi:hypothetical protein